MAAEETTNQVGKGNIINNFNAAQLGLNMDNSIAQIKKGTLTYALNAAVENFDSNSVNYQNEPANQFCVIFPINYTLIGKYFIPEKNKHIFFLVNIENNQSQIGYMVNNDCVYRPLLTAECLNFDINYPIHKVVHRITNCTTEIYWTDGLNSRRFLDIDNVPISGDICNKLRIQPDFNIPQLSINEVTTGGDLLAGTYQFAIQYCDAQGFGYTSYYSVTNPIPIANSDVTTAEFNYPVNKSINLTISNLEIGGYYEYYNLAVIKTVNSITSVELIGTYYINSSTDQVTYTGQNQTQIRLSLNDIFEKFPYYDIAGDVTSVQDVLMWDQLTTNKRINYQSIAAQITLNWETYKIPAGSDYSNPDIAAKLRGYLRDEIYAFEICFLLRNGRQTDGFHIPGRAYNEAVDGVKIYKTGTSATADFIGTPTGVDVNGQYSPKWKIYNTASVTGVATGNSINNATPYQYGQFAFWESEEQYQGTVFTSAGLTGGIRHHKFPDVLVSPIFESATLVGGLPVTQFSDAVYPLGVRVDIAQIKSLITNSSLSADEKAEIVGFKILRGNRSANKSIVGKGVLRNVGKYTREGTDYYFPNYPYNDLNEDPFLLTENNSYNSQSTLYFIAAVTASGSLSYTSCSTGQVETIPLTSLMPDFCLCSLTFPILQAGASAAIANPGIYTVTVGITSDSSTTFTYVPPNIVNCGVPVFPYEYVTVTAAEGIKYIAINSTSAVTYTGGSKNYTVTLSDSVNAMTLPSNLDAFSTDASKFRNVFNSPETSFGQPSLGSVLKVENAIFGESRSHFVEVKNNARYKLINRATQQQALQSSYNIAMTTGTLDGSAMFTTYQAYLQIYINGLSRSNFAYSFNSTASYDYWATVANQGNKQRELDIYQYLIPGIQSTGDNNDINNFQRESSVYLKTAGSTPLPFVSNVPAVSSLSITDTTRFIASQNAKCGSPEDVISNSTVMYYASLKNIIPNQYGQLYSYETIDTGFQIDLDTVDTIGVVFGGDTFVSRFAFKTKLPFFIDNRVGAPDDSDIFYDEIGNIAYPRYWHSSRSILSNYQAGTVSNMTNVISVKATALDCPNDPIFVKTGGTTTTSTTQAPGTVTSGNTNYGYLGKMYMFAYGIPYFYCESSINTDLRQAVNNLDGDFYPHVSSGIPDTWLQQTNVPIALDNTYNYNVTFSKQNTENFFSHLPIDWDGNNCRTVYPFRVIYSDAQVSDPTSKVNNWLIYRPVSFFDFPQSYGDLISLDGIQNKAVLARFENKSLLYNTMLTINTSNPQAAYVGNDALFRSAPPIDFAETNLGYVGSQNKFLLKIPQGQITVDAKRGQVFLISGNQATDLTAFGSGVNRFMTDHLAFEILRYFPDADIDNNFSTIGLHGVFDSKFDRIIITKLDYIPQPNYVGIIKYGDSSSYPLTYKKYYIGTQQSPTIVSLLDLTYFCNKSWTLSFNLNTRSWISFHSYIPNYYIAENNFFYSGLSQGCGLSFVAADTRITTTTTTTLAPSTSTTTTTTVRPTTTTTTTTAGPITTTTTTTVPGPILCYAYNGQNNNEIEATIFWTNCDSGTPGSQVVNPGQYSDVFCAREGSVNGYNFTINGQGPCGSPPTNTTTTTTTISGLTTTTTTVAPSLCSAYNGQNNNEIEAAITWTNCDGTPGSQVVAPGQFSDTFCARRDSVDGYNFTINGQGPCS